MLYKQFSHTLTLVGTYCTANTIEFKGVSRLMVLTVAILKEYFLPKEQFVHQ